MVVKEWSYTSTPPMGCTTCTESQCLYKGALYLTFTLSTSLYGVIVQNVHLYVYFCDCLWPHNVFSLPQTSINEYKIIVASILFGMP